MITQPVEVPAAAPQRLSYVPALDGLRAIAVGLVVASHAGRIARYLRGGWLGVDIFFALSGFLITALLLQEQQRSGRIALGHFYLRRILRLMPALMLMLAAYTVYALVEWHHIDNPHLWLHTALVAATYRYNLYASTGRAVSPGLLHTWTLGFEEQFYLVWPLLLMAFLALGLRGRRLLGATGALIVASAAWRIWLSVHGASINHLYYGPDTRADALLVGCFAGQLYLAGIPERARSWIKAAVPLILLGGLIIVVVVSDHARTTYLWLTALDIAAAALVVAIALGALPGLLKRLLETRLMVYLGKISYSIYLWHFPMIFIVAPHFPAGVREGVIAGTLPVAALSYHLVEQPIVGLRRKLGSRTARGAEAEPAPERPNAS